jgi:hypothetical protein
MPWNNAAILPTIPVPTTALLLLVLLLGAGGAASSADTPLAPALVKWAAVLLLLSGI